LEGDGVATIDPARIKPWIGDPPRTEAPETPGYTVISHEQLNLVSGSLVGFVLIPVWWFVFALLVAALGGPLINEIWFDVGNLIAGAFIALILVPVLHEAIHGLAAMLVGARPSYGIGPGFAYTTFREPMGRWPYLFVGLAPLVVLSIACILLAAQFESLAGALIFFAVINAAGAIGDLWMSWRIIRQPHDAIFYDLADGFAVLTPTT
jgi:hypothetical protein